MTAETRRPKPVTIAQVASHAGVSLSTVSKALNGRGQLREETRRRVLASADELGFQPNLVARSLLSGLTYTVGILTTDSIGRFTIPLLTGAEDALGAGEMAMILCESRGDPIREQYYLKSLLARRVDGIIVTGKSSDKRRSLGRSLPVPVVYALAESDDPEDLSLLHDDEQGARIAIEHLLGTGRRKIAHVTGPERSTASRNRETGTLSALNRGGTELVLPTLFGDWSERWGRDAADRLIRSGVEFDGVFCGNDQIARGLVDGLTGVGIRVPEDVGVVGVDNWSVMVEASRPPLTSVDLNLHELGHTAASRLLRAIQGHPMSPRVEKLPCSLVPRRSTEV